MIIGTKPQNIQNFKKGNLMGGNEIFKKIIMSFLKGEPNVAITFYSSVHDSYYLGIPINNYFQNGGSKFQSKI
jgi:hypothetical protein